MTSARQTLGPHLGPFVPSKDAAARIAAQDSALAVRGAVYRAETKLRELAGIYESECSKIRAAMLAEIADIQIDGGD